MSMFLGIRCSLYFEQLTFPMFSDFVSLHKLWRMEIKAIKNMADDDIVFDASFLRAVRDA